MNAPAASLLACKSGEERLSSARKRSSCCDTSNASYDMCRGREPGGLPHTPFSQLPEHQGSVPASPHALGNGYANGHNGHASSPAG